MRALRNVGASRFAPGNAFKIGLTGFGPNINIVRDPRFGRNSELPGEDPVLSGEYAGAFVAGMQEPDARGHPKMLAFLKHFTAYSVETNRGHDDYSIDPYDFFDTWVAAFLHCINVTLCPGTWRNTAARLPSAMLRVSCAATTPKMATPPAPTTSSSIPYASPHATPSFRVEVLDAQVLRGEFKADAVVTSDCGAVSNLKGAPVYADSDEKAAAFALNNGTDLEMGSKIYTEHLALAIHLGLTTEAAVDAAIKRLYGARTLCDRQV
jgi:beta-glucosidase-like glycosyl hydrolase